jgi:hypothetical protein
MIETQVEGTVIPEAVPVEGVVPNAEVLEGAGSRPEVAIAPEATEEVRDDALPESSMDVVVRFPEIQEAEPIRSAPMSETAMTSHGRLELLSNELIDPAMVARNLESMRRAEQWMKVPLSSQIPQELSTQVMVVALCRMSWIDPNRNQKCSRGMAKQCSG